VIISRTPFRISFFGGGTDYPGWYETHGGAVLSAAINRYCYLTCRRLPPFFPHRFRIAYSVMESTKTVEEIQHPSVRACLQFMDIQEGLEIHHDSDLPKQSGLGTSSSFAVGLLHTLHRFKGQSVDARQLAREAIHVERVLCGENVGSQDQVATALGGLNHITFGPGEQWQAEPVRLAAERQLELQRHLMLFFTGFSRFASEIVVEQLQNMSRKTAELNQLRAFVDDGQRILTGAGSLDGFGALLHEGWMLKRSLSSRISKPEIDTLYEAARRAGALGGKICGAGGGGFLLLFARPEQQQAIKSALAPCLHVPFAFDHQGTQIIFSETEQPT
jgi:D-glycero-alpha-D-manno-heptose-7-phosphate kinase